MGAEHTSQVKPATQPVRDVRALLAEYGLTVMDVAREIGHGTKYGAVYRTLDPVSAPKVRHGVTVLVRKRTEELLRAAGWTGDTEALWAAHDDPSRLEGMARKAA